MYEFGAPAPQTGDADGSPGTAGVGETGIALLKLSSVHPLADRLAMLSKFSVRMTGRLGAMSAGDKKGERQNRPTDGAPQRCNTAHTHSKEQGFEFAGARASEQPRPVCKLRHIP